MHRIGRTGRSQRTGTAYAFFTPANAHKANDLIEVLEEAKQIVNPKLYELCRTPGLFKREQMQRYYFNIISRISIITTMMFVTKEDVLAIAVEAACVVIWVVAGVVASAACVIRVTTAEATQEGWVEADLPAVATTED